MQILFLGTGSCYPTVQRGVSCTLLRLDDGQIWMFDCGEGSQIQIQKCSYKPSKISKIFITHLHGDHLFGLPGLMCTLSTNTPERNTFVLELYGPVGLRKYIRENLNISCSDLNFKYKVNELVPEESLLKDWNKTSQHVTENQEDNHPSEIMGNQINANKELVWEICKTDDFQVTASQIVHTIPCFGFVMCEESIPGNLDVEKLKKLGVPPGPMYASIKNGQTITLDKGITIFPSDVLGPKKPGRKITILGDTCDALNMKHLANDSDVLIHETTLQNSMESKAIEHGHSTPKMAVSFAELINAKVLIISHFSQRYKNDDNDSSSISKLLDECENFKNPELKYKIIGAEDLMEYSVPRPK